eukprot:11110571-Lingulodinium_polyedra.AAC.1
MEMSGGLSPPMDPSTLPTMSSDSSLAVRRAARSVASEGTATRPSVAFTVRVLKTSAAGDRRP